MLKDKKRLCICVFWDKNGVVRDYVKYYLKGLQEITKDILFVSNGALTEDSKSELQKLNINIFERENKGLDFGGWKDAIEDIGYDKLAEYDELILTNTTCYGPVYPLSEMFEEMENRDCDFWGLTKHPICYSEMLSHYQTVEHIQSYFLVFNNNVITSSCFKNWWKNVEYYNDFHKVVAYYEVQLTRFFEEHGFKSDSYVDMKKYEHYTLNPSFVPYKILSEMRLPLIKRKSIVYHYKNTKVTSDLTHFAKDTLIYLRDVAKFDIEMIYDDIIHTQPMSEIRANLHLNYILPYDYEYNKVPCNKKIALILYIYYEDMVDYCFNYAKSMPEGTDIYIICAKETTLTECKSKAYMLQNYNLIYRLKENRGRDVSAYLVTCADVWDKYDYICCVHDKKSPHVDAINAEEFSYQCFECNLKNKTYVSNIINTFETNSKIGMLFNPLPAFGCFYGIVVSNEISINHDDIRKLYRLLNLTIPFDEHPVAPFGSMFWIRGDAIKPLFRHKWIYDDFPQEPFPADGTISHAIERIYPSVVQEAGYLAGWVMPNDFSQIYLDNILYSPDEPKKSRKQKKKHHNPLSQIFSMHNVYIGRTKLKLITILGRSFKINLYDKKNAVLDTVAKVMLSSNPQKQEFYHVERGKVLEQVFSIQKDIEMGHRIITLFGLSLKLKSRILAKQKEFLILQNKHNELIDSYVDLKKAYDEKCGENEYKI